MPRDDEVKVTFDSLEEGAKAMFDAMQSMEAELDLMAKKLDPMVQSWDGDARASYYENQIKWRQSATELNEVGMMFSQAVIKARNIMWDAEASAVSLQRGFSI